MIRQKDHAKSMKIRNYYKDPNLPFCVEDDFWLSKSKDYNEGGN